MAERKILILPSEVVKRIDENRGDLSQADFIETLIDNQFKEKEKTHETKYATKEEMDSFQEDMKRLLRSFLDFFVAYGLDIGKQSPTDELEALTTKLQGLQKDIGSDNDKGGKATIRWK
jgi:hypothetical protein